VQLQWCCATQTEMAYALGAALAYTNGLGPSAIRIPSLSIFKGLHPVIATVTEHNKLLLVTFYDIRAGIEIVLVL